MFTYSDIAIKLVVGFIFISVLINLTGKGNLAPTSAMDQLQNYVLGGIVGGVLYNPAITLAEFITVLLLWSLLILGTRYLKTHIHAIGKFLEGEPITIVKNGQILVENCLKANLSAKDVDFKLRTAGVYDVKDVKRAILEQNGSLTVLRKGDGSIRYPVVVDGQLDYDVLDLMEEDEEWLYDKLGINGPEEIKTIFMATYRHGEMTVVKYQ
ncbi:DUF421 domain-containing protein [Lentilactobacillus sp. SPB1-3]|uniref:DUF421 domain-containing protein n=1 Tax=Lentilactobacillus terminaliae TaxID=3003483 RepID=A0ACD5DEX7_9LACO|nr:DUF421 domain-containing protein [Lentilactobacillus sp. SPB1-3]MCZ0976347.1 DUF421 domain-containing protein [Lentilactobacillus sp. SPB1-3]